MKCKRAETDEDTGDAPMIEMIRVLCCKGLSTNSQV